MFFLGENLPDGEAIRDSHGIIEPIGRSEKFHFLSKRVQHVVILGQRMTIYAAAAM